VSPIAGTRARPIGRIDRSR